VVNVWRTESGELLQTLNLFPTATVTSLAVRPDGTILACGLREDRVCVWELLSDRIVYSCTQFSPCIMSPDGSVLVYATASHEIIVWDLATYQQLCALQGHTESIAYLIYLVRADFLHPTPPKVRCTSVN
jgi:WD40 repeat protein